MLFKPPPPTAILQQFHQYRGLYTVVSIGLKVKFHINWPLKLIKLNYLFHLVL